MTARGFASSPDPLPRLLESLGKDPETAARRYRVLRDKLINLFERERGIVPSDLADECLCRLGKCVEKGDIILEPEKFVLGIAQHVRQEALREQFKFVSLDRALEGEGPVDPFGFVDHMELEESVQRLTACVNSLKTEDRELLTAYSSVNDHTELAIKHGTSFDALRSRVYRARNRIRKCLERSIVQKQDRHARPSGDTKDRGAI